MKRFKRTGPYLCESADGLKLIASRCDRKAQLQFPPPEFVPEILPELDVQIGPVGRLYTFSIVHPGRDKRPYGVAMVDFPPGVRVFGRLLHTPGQFPELDSAVRLVPFCLEDGTADYAFEVVGERSDD